MLAYRAEIELKIEEDGAGYRIYPANSDSERSGSAQSQVVPCRI